VTVDAAARADIRDLHDATLFVEAGAGTGKTTALVNRVVSLIARGRVTIRELAAITFTEAAAGELRDRIRYRLELAAGSATEPVLAPEERAWCRVALDDVDDAALSTLHGFAQRILAEHPLEAGLPPRFEVVDDVEAAVRFEERWGEFLDALVADPELEPVLLPALALGVDFDHLRRVARVLHEHYERLRSAPTVAVPSDRPPVDVGPLLAALEQAIARLAECRVRQDLLFQHVEGLAGWVDALRGAHDDLDLLDLLGEMPKLTARKGKHENWRCPVDEVRTLLEQAEQARAVLIRAQQQSTLDVLVARLRGFVRSYADERRRDGRIEFHDLLVLARDVLARNPRVRATLADRFRVLLIDEFQDTDPLQIEIAVLLASDDPGAGERPWSEVPIAPGRAFFVGDPKQSIYRFRRADLELYHRVERELGEGRRELTQNFRSVPGILEWVNHVFALLFDTAEPGTQAAHVPLAAQRDAVATAAPPVATFGGVADVQLVAEVRAVEAEAVATLVRRIKDDEWEIADPVTGVIRPARYDDVALLLPTRTALPDLEDALEQADVPVRIESQSLVFSTAQVRDLLSILTALDDPTDEIALVASLRSPAFGCGDDELVDYHRHGGRWDYRRTAPDELPADHAVVSAMAALRRLHDARWWQSVSQTVEAIVRERRMLELAVTHRRPRDHWRRIRFFLDQARAYDAASGRGLRGFIEWVQQLADERARAVEIVVPEPDDDALRVLTVHGAKGLEFPIVILAGLNVAPPNRATPVLWNPDGSFEVRVGRVAQGTRFETAGWHERSEREDELDAAERLRLLYVASTRARDHLLVSLHHKQRTPCHAALLCEHTADAPAAALDLEDVAPATEAPTAPTPADGEAAEDPGERDRWIAARARLLARAGRPATVAATTLAKDGFGVSHPPMTGVDDAKSRDPALEKDEPADDRPAWRRGRAGTSVGRAVHAVLQTVDLATGDGLDATARAQALAEGIPQREAEIRALAQSVLHSSTVRGAVTGGRYWREVPVAAIVDGVTVEGFVDLLIETLEGLVVVDYKTDQTPTEDDLDAAMDRYRPQGAAYALALERALDTRVARCVFVFARRRRAVEREVDDLPAALAEVERRVRDLA
jgi:ATP-dependent exoDNAse (exonuclease V) beta subunit